MQKVIVAAGVPINAGFWGASGRITELESKNPGDVSWFGGTAVRLIVPDGCREAYIAAIKAQSEWDINNYTVIEKSESIGLEWLVDENGLLKAYFGLEPDHYVLPAGIKKIDIGSFASDSPTTIVLNEDLEEIGSSSIKSNTTNLQEIIIPKSVKYIDRLAVYAHKIYLHRETSCHEQAFWHLSEIIYLD